jgi:hypothetical protein
MRYRIAFMIGMGAGAAAGVRYGRPAVVALQRRIRDLRERPELQEAAGLVTAQAEHLVDRAREAVSHRSGTPPIRLLNGSSAR